MLGQYLDYERETVLLKTDGLTGEQFVQKLLPSDLTLGGLLYHLALVEESWMEVRFMEPAVTEPRTSRTRSMDRCGLGHRPRLEFRTPADFQPEALRRRYRLHEARQGAGDPRPGIPEQ